MTVLVGPVTPRTCQEQCMRDLALAPPSTPPLTGGLADSLFETATRTPTLPMLARRRDPASSTWEEVTAVEFRDEVVDIAKGRIASGLSPGHRAAIMARPRYEGAVLCHARCAEGAGGGRSYPCAPPGPRLAIVARRR